MVQGVVYATPRSVARSPVAYPGTGPVLQGARGCDVVGLPSWVPVHSSDSERENRNGRSRPPTRRSADTQACVNTVETPQ